MKAQGRTSTTPIQAKRRPDATVEPRFVLFLVKCHDDQHQMIICSVKRVKTEISPQKQQEQIKKRNDEIASATASLEELLDE